VFDGEFGVVETRVVGGRHLKLRLRAPSGELAEAIAFRFVEEGAPPPVRAGDRVTAVFHPSVDDYGGTSRLQLVTEWLAPAGGT
jgi:single-stranded-DNA-specific exonuclease